MILPEWLAFYSAFLNIHRSGVLKHWHGWCHMKLLPSWCKFCVHHTTMHHVTSCKTTYVRCVFSCNLLPALLAERPGSFTCYCGNTGWNGYRNKSQHRKLTLEKKILPPLLQGFKPATFQSWVQRSNHWAIPTPDVVNVQFLQTFKSILDSTWQDMKFLHWILPTLCVRLEQLRLAPARLKTLKQMWLSYHIISIRDCQPHILM